MGQSRNANKTGSLPENLQGPALDGDGFSFIYFSSFYPVNCYVI